MLTMYTKFAREPTEWVDVESGEMLTTAQAKKLSKQKSLKIIKTNETYKETNGRLCRKTIIECKVERQQQELF